MLEQCFLDIDKLGILQHHVNGGMAQQQPHRVQVHAVIEAVGGEVMPEAVGAAAADDPGPFLQAAEHYLDRVAGQGPAVIGLPELIAPRLPHLGQVAFQRLAGLAVHGHHPHLGPLAHDPELAQIRVEVGKLDPGQLGKPEPGVDKERDNGLVSDAQAAALVLLAGIEQGLHLLVRIRLDLAVAGAGHIEPHRRIFREVLLVLGPAEEELDHLGVVIDGGRGRPFFGGAAPGAGPAVLFGGHISQKVGYVLPADLLRVGPVLGPGIPGQSRKAVLVVLHRALGKVSARAKETRHEVVQGQAFGFGFHFSFLPVRLKSSCFSLLLINSRDSRCLFWPILRLNLAPLSILFWKAGTLPTELLPHSTRLRGRTFSPF
ncbi:hypothetical protein LCGC14_0262240 [marine sediment metagenome]|uniref:Uncharacterized protein n=1 Tax=marine sediment metagenome TaxID=412755 RepID=A0A0F9U141_9ZZZZ